VSLRFIELERFRSFPSLSLELDLRGGVLEAPNGRGKTNFLEALHYLNLFRSFRGAPDAELAAFGEQGFRVRGETTVGGGVKHRLGVSVEGSRKRLSIDGREARPAEHVGAVTSVVLSPDDIRLVQGEPSRRRNYLDVVLALSSRRYLKALREYRRVLKQRNRVLQTGGGHALLEPWTEQLVEHGGVILRERLRFLERWGTRLGEISGGLAGSPEGAARWTYECSAQAVAERAARTVAEGPGAATQSGAAVTEHRDEVIEPGASRVPPTTAKTLAGSALAAVLPEGPPPPEVALAEALREDLARMAMLERRRGMTLAGPHRDDLSLRIGVGASEPEALVAPLAGEGVEARRSGDGEAPSGYGSGGRRVECDLRRFGSQGEQRTVALALRFLETQVLAHERGDLPMVLLDDVFSELDPGRSRELLAFLAPGQQVFLTTPKPLAVELPVELPRYTVEDGRVRLVS
jgi:DNA replication and repair protein RecF